MNKATVYIIPTVISEQGYAHIPEIVANQLKEVKLFVVERARTSRRYMKKLVPSLEIQSLEIIEIDKHGNKEYLDDYISWIKKGETVAILSESGMPGVADPGANLVAIAHSYQAKVVPLSGPSSILLALAASGLNGQNFAFRGYLPVKDHELKASIASLVKAATNGQTQLFIETPFRNQRMFDALLRMLPSELKLCIAQDVTGIDEKIITKKVHEWKKLKIKFEKIPVIFLIGN